MALVFPRFDKVTNSWSYDYQAKTVANVIKAPVDATHCHINLCKHEVAGKCACGKSVCISHEYTLHIKEADYSITKKMVCAACRWKK